MPFAAIWMDLEIIKLSKISQKEKDKYHIYNLSVESKRKKLTEENKPVAAKVDGT